MSYLFHNYLPSTSLLIFRPSVNIIPSPSHIQGSQLASPDSDIKSALRCTIHDTISLTSLITDKYSKVFLKLKEMKGMMNFQFLVVTSCHVISYSLTWGIVSLQI